jgi:hypothetical protein
MVNYMKCFICGSTVRKYVGNWNRNKEVLLCSKECKRKRKTQLQKEKRTGVGLRA